MDPHEILSEAEAMGYSIDIETIEDTHHVTLNSTTAIEGYTLPTCWSTAFTPQEVRLECIFELMRWANLTVKQTLTYK